MDNENSTSTSDREGSDAVSCSACEARATDWLTGYMENWNGPKAKWTKKQKDQWCEYLGVLTLFTKDFHFPNSDVHPRSAAESGERGVR